MKGITEMDFTEFPVPQQVSGKSPSDGSSHAFPLKAINDEAFHEMVEAWVKAVYRQAVKNRPPQTPEA